MGLFDDVTVLIGRGMDSVDKKSQEVKYNSELTKKNAEKEKLLADLGRNILIKEGSNKEFIAEYATEVKAIGDIELQCKELQRKIKELQSTETLVGGSSLGIANAVSKGYRCTVCGTPVSLESKFCPMCGDNLKSLKAQFVRCPSCNEYLPAGSLFCERCGTRTVSLDAAPDGGDSE